ncbi:MAG: leucyl/phenylalanyl-tRNA--protein transferase [Gammaproteobacteria bacterium]
MIRVNDTAPYWIDSDDPEIAFPDVELALRDPDGLLALGGDLSVPRLLHAYRHGIFPWFGPRQPILWWSPDPRLVLRPHDLHISRSLARTLRKDRFRVTLDRDFRGVIERCAAPRPGQAGTWITPEMQTAYVELHAAGYAHSAECWLDDVLVGGLYGVAIGRIFFGESMFTRVPDASKVVFVQLVRELQQREFRLIDCQVHTGHLASLGATVMPRREFVRILGEACDIDTRPGPWSFTRHNGI